MLVIAGAAAGAGAAWLAWQWAVGPGGPLRAREISARHAPGTYYEEDGVRGVVIGAYIGADGRKKVFGTGPVAPPRDTVIESIIGNPAGRLGPTHLMPGGTVTVIGANVDVDAKIQFVAHHLRDSGTRSEYAGVLEMPLTKIGPGLFSIPHTALESRRYDNGGPSFVTKNPAGDYIIEARLVIGDANYARVYFGARATTDRPPRGPGSDE